MISEIIQLGTTVAGLAALNEAQSPGTPPRSREPNRQAWLLDNRDPSFSSATAGLDLKQSNNQYQIERGRKDVLGARSAQQDIVDQLRHGSGNAARHQADLERQKLLNDLASQRASARGAYDPAANRTLQYLGAGARQDMAAANAANIAKAEREGAMAAGQVAGQMRTSDLQRMAAEMQLERQRQAHGVNVEKLAQRYQQMGMSYGMAQKKAEQDYEKTLLSMQSEHNRMQWERQQEERQFYESLGTGLMNMGSSLGGMDFGSSDSDSSSSDD